MILPSVLSICYTASMEILLTEILGGISFCIRQKGAFREFNYRRCT
jgi:hypothetical protein